MDIHPVAGVHAGQFVIHLEGRDYLRHDRHHWYDAKSHLGLPAIEANRLASLVRSSPALLEDVEAAKKAALHARHRARVESFGIPYRGAGPSSGWINRCAHCWACHRQLDSAIDLQCYVCGWILCGCGGCGCGCGYVWGNHK